ncbi:MAG TPA: DMT family transporter, partial [Nitriliruptoraceae bacterium]|nr:DMT family transporter [Nitriliruptoraceae bacterium]
MSPITSPTRRAVAAALLVTVLWSSSWILIRMGLDDQALPPLTFAGMRYGMAALVLAAWTLRSQPHRREVAALDGRSWRRLVVLGVVFYTVTQGAQFIAIDNQPAATSSLVLSLTPLVVALWAGRTLGEPATPRQFGGAVLVAFGAVLFFAGDLAATTVGMVAAVVGLLANATSVVLGRDVNRTGLTSPVVVTSISMGVGAGLLVAIGLVVEGVPSVPPTAWAVVAWLAVVNTAIAFSLWNWSMRF